jgi:hypothetical protein
MFLCKKIGIAHMYILDVAVSEYYFIYNEVELQY